MIVTIAYLIGKRLPRFRSWYWRRTGGKWLWGLRSFIAAEDIPFFPKDAI